MIRLESLEGFVQLLAGGLLVSAIELGHEKDAVAGAIAQGFSHSHLAHCHGNSPAVVQEVHGRYRSRCDDADAFLFGRPADVRAAESDHGDFFAGVPERAVGDIRARVRAPRKFSRSGGDGGDMTL